MNHALYLTGMITKMVDEGDLGAAYRLLSFLQALMLFCGIEKSIADLMRRNMPDDAEFTETPHG